MAAFAAAGAQAKGLPVLEMTTAHAGTLLESTSPSASGFEGTTATHSTRAAPQARAIAPVAKQAADAVPSEWAMLLVGAGVLLLPRHRRPDNAVR